MIQLKDVTFYYSQSSEIYDGLTWNIGKPEMGNHIHFILSPSGYGKSTLFKLILKVINPQKGIVKIDDGARISYVPQEPVLFEHLSIYDNATFFKYLLARKKEFNIELFNEYAKILGLDDTILRSKKNVTQLSGGQKRKLSLLKALSLNPNILLLDEPTTGLDAQIKMGLLSQLKDLVHKYNILVLYITHHFEEAVLIGDKVHYLLKNPNGVIANISTQDIQDFKLNPPCLEAAYLVDFPDNRIQKGDYNGKNFSPNELSGRFHLRTIENNSQLFSPNGFPISDDTRE
mgnify:CR=1 FL=1